VRYVRAFARIEVIRVHYVNMCYAKVVPRVNDPSRVAYENTSMDVTEPRERLEQKDSERKDRCGQLFSTGCILWTRVSTNKRICGLRQPRNVIATNTLYKNARRLPGFIYERGFCKVSRSRIRPEDLASASPVGFFSVRLIFLFGTYF